MVQGLRPDRPENALVIGFSDLLWDFVQHCWDSDVKLRPKVAEVVTHLGDATVNWNRLMPPSIQPGNTASDSKELLSDSMEHREFEISIFL